MAVRKGVGRVLVDVGPLRESHDFRRLWLGAMLSGLGSQMTLVGVPIQLYALTGSSLAVGLAGLVRVIPLLGIGLLAGSLVDAVDRRRLALLVTALRALVSLSLAGQALLGLKWVWLLYVLTGLASALTAIDMPARQTFTPRLLPPERLPAAAALSSLSFQVNLVVGPLAAGVVIASAGVQVAYAIDAVSFLCSLYAVARLRPMPALGARKAPGLQSVAEGLRFLRRQPVLAAVLLADLNATIFALPTAVFPALAATHFGGGARTVGWLYAGIGIGGIVAATLSGRVSHVRRQGLAVLLSIGLWGAAFSGFALTSRLDVAVALLAVAGAADVVNGIFRNTLLQVNTPDALRGRVGSVGFMVGAGGPQLGDVESGTVAAFTSPVVSAVSGGLICLAGIILIGLLVPALRRYDGLAAAERARDRDAGTPGAELASG